MLLGCLAASAYFAYHAVNGTHGLRQQARLIERERLLDREIAGLQTVRDRLKRDVAALAAEPPHPDIVEETARTLLGWARPGDIEVRNWR